MKTNVHTLNRRFSLQKIMTFILPIFIVILIMGSTNQLNAQTPCINYSGPTTDLCPGQPVSLSAGCIDPSFFDNYCGPGSVVSIEWYRDGYYVGYGYYYYAFTSGSYSVRVKYNYESGWLCYDNYPIYYSNSVSLTFNYSSFPPSSIGKYLPFCPGYPTTLYVQGGSLGTNAEWVWYENGCGGTSIGTGPSIQVDPQVNTIYYVRAESGCPLRYPENNCASTLVNPNPQISAPTAATAGPSTICSGGISTLTVHGIAGAQHTIEWYSDAAMTQHVATGQFPQVSPATTTTYWVRYESNPYCNYQTTGQSVTVNVTEITGTSAGDDTYVLFGSSAPAVTQYNCATLTATGSTGGTEPYNYVWTNNLDPLFSEAGSSINVCPTADTEYTVTVTDANGCTSSDVVLVKAYNVGCGNGNTDKVSVCITTPSGNSNTICVNQTAVDNLLSSNPNATLGSCEMYKKDNAIIDMEPLLENVPNPFSGVTKVKIRVAEDGEYQLHIFDVTGKVVGNILQKQLIKGETYSIDFNSDNLAAGVYYYTLTGNNLKLSKQMVILK